MSPQSRDLATYHDVEELLEQARLDPKGIQFDLGSKGSALRWRHRAYTFRKLLREQNAELIADLPGATAATKFDNLVIAVASATVTITKQPHPSNLRTLNGEPLTITEVEVIDDELT